MTDGNPTVVDPTVDDPPADNQVADSPAAGRPAIGSVVEVAIAALFIAMVAGLAAGYRPVVLTTDSMAPTAPTGSLLIVASVSPEQVQEGDVLVMRRPSKDLLTHRVIELTSINGQTSAVTKGDANQSPDPRPYMLNGDQQVAKVILPGVGSVLMPIVGHTTRTAGFLVVVAAVAMAISAVRRAREPVVEESVDELVSAESRNA